jgi:hypothetical protein
VDYCLDDVFVQNIETFRFSDNAANGFIATEIITISGTKYVIRTHGSDNPEGMQYWMTHYTHDGTVGVSGTATSANTLTIKDGLVTHIA